MPQTISQSKIFWLVLLAHLAGVAILILLTSSRSRKFYANPVTTVDLVEPLELSSAPEKEAAPPPPVEPLPPEKPLPKAEPEKPEPPRKITKKAPAIFLPPSDLKKRLEQKMAQVKTESPRSTDIKGSPGVATSTVARVPFSWYQSYISAKMHNLWKQPAKAAVGKDKATALISFRVYRDGHIESIRLQRSSGSKVMDESVLQAVRTADPLDPPPTGFIKGRYENLDILFELSD